MEDHRAQSETAARDSDQRSVAREPGVDSDNGVPDCAEVVALGLVGQPAGRELHGRRAKSEPPSRRSAPSQSVAEADGEVRQRGMLSLLGCERAGLSSGLKRSRVVSEI